MKFLILAAGLGKRLGKNLPKSLVKLANGKTILEHQLENINKFSSINNVAVVTGYKKEIIENEFPNLKQVVNDRFAVTNTAKSLLLGLSQINEDFIFMNGDIVFDPQILKEIIDLKSSNLVCVNSSNVGEEEIKYSLDTDNFINKISKAVPNPLGEAVGINLILKENINVLRQSLSECEDNDYFERGIEYCIEKGVKFAPHDIKEQFLCRN